MLSFKAMQNSTKNQQFLPFLGSDLERWRLDNSLSRAAAADAFGLQPAKWDELTSPKRLNEKIADPVVAMLLYIYRHSPESAPILVPPDVKEFYDFLGLRDSPQDRNTFATLIGRSPPSVYRMLDDGNPGRPVLRWIEAVRRLKLTPKKSLELMTTVATSVSGQ